jgi:hypothetical protein
MASRCLLSGLLVVFFISGVTSRLTAGPANNAALVGHNVTFECRTNSPATDHSVTWQLHGLDTHIPPLLIYNGTDIAPEFKDRYSVLVNMPTGQFDLHITNTSQVDAGTYTCIDVVSHDNASAIYAVLASEPYCFTTADPNTTVVGDSIVLTCNVTYNGSLWQRPLMAWYRDSELVQNVSNVTNPNVDVLSSYTLTAAVPTLPSYECLTFFGELVPSSDEPVNLSRSIPSYNYSWSSVNQTVYFGPINTTIEVPIINGTNNSIVLNDTLSCSSTANPPLVTYTWDVHDSSTDSQIVTPRAADSGGGQFVVTRTGRQNISCTAHSTLRGQEHNDTVYVAVHVLFGPTNTTITVPYIAGTNDRINVNATLSCSSVADPSNITFSWTDRNSSDEAGSVSKKGGAGPVFRAAFEGWRTISCTAHSTLKEIDHNQTASVNVLVVAQSAPPGGLSAAIIAAITVVSAILVLVLVLAVYLYWRRIRGRHPYRHMVDDAAAAGDDEATSRSRIA